jgi:CheY-like chemotaxis protein
VGRLPPLALVVDDAEDMRLLVAAVAQHAGFHVATARDGNEALQQLRSGRRPAVIVTDVDMPVMNGLELFVAIRGELGLRDTPVIFHSASREPISFDEGSASRWLAKPADPSELLRLLETVG